MSIFVISLFATFIIINLQFSPPRKSETIAAANGRTSSNWTFRRVHVACSKNSFNSILFAMRWLGSGKGGDKKTD
jgi:hypothetical protein